MTRTQAVLLTLVAYKVVLVLIGLWASRRTRDDGDFFLGGRRLGATVAAISASASSSSAWTLLSVSGMACLWGLPALWLFPATLSGFLINWLFVAPRLQRQSRDRGAITLTGFLAASVPAAGRNAVLRLAAGITLFCFVFYIASQFQAAGHAFASSLDLDMLTSILIGAGIIAVYTLLGGFWAASVTDTLQGLVMAAVAVILPLTAFIAVGGWDGLVSGLAAVGAAGAPVPTGGIAGVGFVLGTLGIGLGYPGQPHVVNRFMALRDERALAGARVIAIAWAVVIYAGMLLLGLCGRVLFGELIEPERVLFEVAERLMSPVAAGVVVAAVLSAVMSTADSQLLVAGSSVTHDLPGAAGHPATLTRSRLTVLGVSVVAVALALWLPDTIFNRVLFAWHGLGSAFGPVLLLCLCGRPPGARAMLLSMATGFGLTLFFNWFVDSPGDVVERLVPLLAAFAVAWFGRAPVDGSGAGSDSPERSEGRI
jgi:sodium/proline symporter